MQVPEWGCPPFSAAATRKKRCDGLWGWILVALIAAIVPPTRAAAQRSRGGTIRGRVDVRHLAGPVERRPNVADFGAPIERDVPNRRTSIVYLDQAPRGAFEEPPPGQHAVMDQRNETFVPHVLAITVGTTVDFPNSDQFYHDVFSLSKNARFDLGRYPAGKSKSIRFDRPGIVRVFCDIHSHMNAFIVVFSHPFFATTDDSGAYHIDNVPAGTYNVLAWNEGATSAPKPVAVSQEAPAEADFIIR